MKKIVRRGEIYYADLDPVVGSEQGGVRPVLILQNDIGNKHSPTVIVASISCHVKKLYLPTHVLTPRRVGLEDTSMLMGEQIRTIDKQRLRGYVGMADQWLINKVESALGVSLDLKVEPKPVDGPEPEDEPEHKAPYFPEFLDGFEDEKPTPPPDVMELCLCPQCASQFYNSPEHRIYPINRKNAVKEDCTYCQVRQGYDYRIIHAKKRLGDDHV